jgi:hypothetical protein
VEFKGQRLKLPLVFVTSPRKRGWFVRQLIEAFDAVSVNTVGANSRLNSLLQEFADVFDSPTTGFIRDHKANVHFKPDAQFRINKPRPVPYAYRQAVEDELERLSQQGVINEVDVAEFTTTPLIVVRKPNGTSALQRYQIKCKYAPQHPTIPDAYLRRSVSKVGSWSPVHKVRPRQCLYAVGV